MSHTLVNAIESYGLVAIFVLMAAESCAIPFPSEVIMPFAGAFAALGHLDLAGAVLVGAAGNLAGSLVAYLLAARFGKPVLLGAGRWVGISRAHLDLAERWFSRYGLAAVFVGRMVPVVRTYISFPAGLSRLRLGRFLGLTFAGALPWCAALAALGYVLGADYTLVSGPIEKAAAVIALLIALSLILWFVRGRKLAQSRGGNDENG